MGWKTWKVSLLNDLSMPTNIGDMVICNSGGKAVEKYLLDLHGPVVLYAERRPVQREVINAWLSSDEGIAASRAAADRRPQRRNDRAPDNTGSSGRPR